MITKKLLIRLAVFTCAMGATSAMAAVPVMMQPGFFIGAEGDWLTQDNYSSHYFNIKSASGVTRRVNTQLGYPFSGGATIGYLFNNNTDISFSFLINDHTHTDSVATSAGEIGIPSNSLGFGIGVSDALRNTYSNPTLATSQFSVRSDLYNIVAGHWIKLSDTWDIHPFIGINISDLRGSQVISYTGFTKTPPKVVIPGSVVSYALTNQATGAGPLVGMDGEFHITQRMGLVWQTSLALLASSFTQSSTTTNNLGITNYPNNPSTINLTLFGLAQGQIGLNYQLPIKTPVDLSVGYRAVTFINYPGTDACWNNFMGPYVSLAATI